MNKTEFRNLIREEIRRVLKEVEQSIAPYYYMQFNGTVQPMGTKFRRSYWKRS